MSNMLTIPSASFDGKTIANTTLYTPDTGSTQRFFVTGVQFELLAVATLTTPPTVSVGTNSATYNNLIVATALTGMTTVNHVQGFVLTSAIISSIAATTPILCRVSVGAIAGTYAIRAMLAGYYA